MVVLMYKHSTKHQKIGIPPIKEAKAFIHITQTSSAHGVGPVIMLLEMLKCPFSHLNYSILIVGQLE